MMVAKTPDPVPFEQESTLFRSINEKMDEAYCDVYAPIEWQSATERKQVVSGVRKDVLDCINAACRTNKAKKGVVK